MTAARTNAQAEGFVGVVGLVLNEGLTPWEVQSYIGHRYPGSSRVEAALAKFLPVTTG